MSGKSTGNRQTIDFVDSYVIEDIGLQKLVLRKNNKVFTFEKHSFFLRRPPFSTQGRRIRNKKNTGFLLQVGSKKRFYFIKRDFIRPVIQIRMICTGNDHQLLIAAFELFESVFAEIAAVCIFSVQH